MSFLRIDAVSKSFGANTVVQKFDLSIRKGEFVSLLGPSGCGKTTVLRMVAGFETPSSGAVVINGQDVTQQPPNRRRIGMVFQAYALFPNMNVFDNVAFGLKIAGMAKAEIAARVAEMLKLIGLDHLADRYPYQMSGGQQQRVGIARAIVGDPSLLLCDEPTGDLDRRSADEALEMLGLLNRELGKTIVMVTHDPVAAKAARRTLHLDKGVFRDEARTMEGATR